MSIDPKRYVTIDDSELVNLNRKLAQVLCAIAEAVIGDDFSTIMGAVTRLLTASKASRRSSATSTAS